MSLRVIAVAASAALLASCKSSTDVSPTVTYTATLNGANEVPARAVTGTGLATFTLKNNLMTYTVVVNGLTGPATASHIHAGVSTCACPVVFPFAVTAVATGTVAGGVIDFTLTTPTGSNINSDSLMKLFNNGNGYVNVHTAAFPGGEVRGPLVKSQ